ncbi:hypothetical protein AB0D10_41825 [Kitasatospora sp. NPDC048545]|uniref:hypothetical protein n=1 Tax=Kitasatospora sp. NPDC048545 TaxID=3157208 RepID=UPI0033E9DB6F
MQLVQDLVQAAQDAAGRLLLVVGDHAQHVADLAHQRGCFDAVAHHVADHQARDAVGQVDEVVPVAADPGRLRGRLVAGVQLQALDGGHRRKQAALEVLRRAAQLAVEPGVLDGDAGRAGQGGDDVLVDVGEGGAVGLVGEVEVAVVAASSARSEPNTPPASGPGLRVSPRPCQSAVPSRT